MKEAQTLAQWSATVALIDKCIDDLKQRRRVAMKGMRQAHAKAKKAGVTLGDWYSYMRHCKKLGEN